MTDTDLLVKGLDKIAEGFHTVALALEAPASHTPVAAGALGEASPAVSGGAVTPSGTCLIHEQPWKIVPAGVSERTGKPYKAFAACPERGCKERPSQAWYDAHPL